VDTAVWILAGIFALNAVIVGAVAVYEVVDRVRADRQIATLERLWRSPSAFVARAGERRGFGRRLSGLTLATAVLAAGILQANEGTRQVFTSALSVAVPIYAHDLQQHPRPRAVPSEHPTPALWGASRRTHLDERTAQPPVTEGPGVANSDDPTVPATVAAVGRSASEIEVIWLDVDGALGYSVERSDDGATDWKELTTTEAEVTNYVDGGLRSGTTYFYRIAAQTADGAEAHSDVVAATTDIAPPGATSAVANATSATSITLSWSDVIEEEGYRVERSPDGESGWIPVGMTSIDVTAFTDQGVEAETTYFYRVFATNLGGDSLPSPVVSAQTPPAATGGTDGADGGGGAPSPTDGAAADVAAPAAPGAAAAPDTVVEAAGAGSVDATAAPDAADAAATPDPPAA
jgi:hypothetical protein